MQQGRFLLCFILLFLFPFPVNAQRVEGHQQQSDGCALVKEYISLSQVCFDLQAGETLIAITAFYEVYGSEMQIPSGFRLKTILNKEAAQGQFRNPATQPQNTRITLISQKVNLVDTSQKDRLVFEGTQLVQLNTSESGKLIFEVPDLTIPMILCYERRNPSSLGWIFGQANVCEGDQPRTFEAPASEVTVKTVSFTPAPAPQQSPKNKK